MQFHEESLIQLLKLRTGDERNNSAGSTHSAATSGKKPPARAPGGDLITVIRHRAPRAELRTEGAQFKSESTD